MAFLIDAFRGPSKDISSANAPGRKRRRVGKGGSVFDRLLGSSKPGKVMSTGRSPESSDTMRKRFERESRVRSLGRETRP